jgi:hypothetical protein
MTMRLTPCLTALFLAVALPAMAGDAVDPANFTTAVTNPWLPLTPGSVLSYEGNVEGRPASLLVTVTDKTKQIAGVNCRVVEEFVALAGRPNDRTLAYYAQDLAGNVWYFGEDVQELDKDGNVTKTEGWKTGVDGAIPSLVMEANPTAGHILINTYTSDHSEVVSLAKAVKTPSGTYPDALETKEWTPDEPDVMVNKYYVQGIGLVRNVVVKGDPEEFVLVAVKK